MKMTDQLEQTVLETDSAASAIEAEVAWTVSNRPPEVVLSFEGLHEPEELWPLLADIGWVVPGMPPRPANAIDWTPDPVAGTDYTVLPWRVKDFRLEEGTWKVDEEMVGQKTLDALLDHNATIVGSSEQIAEHAKTYEARKAERLRQESNPIQAHAPAQGSQTTDQSAVVDGVEDLPIQPAVAEDTTHTVDEAIDSCRFVLVLNLPTAKDPLPGAGTWKGVAGLQKTEVTWNELSLSAGEEVPDQDELTRNLSGPAHAWIAETETKLDETAGNGRRIVRLFIPGLTVRDAKVRRMNKVLGDNIESHQLRPLGGGEATAVLVSASVAANSFEMLKSNLCLRMPKAVIRTRA